MLLRSLFLFLMLILSFSTVNASSDELTDNTSVIADPTEEKDPRWYYRKAEGWFWKDVDPEEVEPEEEKVEVEPSLVNPDSLYPSMDQPLLDPLATLDTLQKAVEKSKARAVLQPTQENLYNWIKVQNELLKKNTLFADNWQRLIWKNPEYDYNQVRPTNPVALSTYSQAYKKEQRLALREIAKDFGLYFVIAEGCPYCHAMAPYLSRFAETYGFTVIAVSTDGGSVPEYPDPMYSPEFAETLGVKTTPAIILAKPSEGVIEPIAYGFISLKELETRIFRLFRLEPGQPNYRVSNTFTR